MLVQNHLALVENKLDLSIVPDDKKEHVLNLAVEKAKENNDDEATRHILFYLEDWDQLLDMAKEKIANPDPEIHRLGLRNLWPLIHKHQSIPKDSAVELVELELEGKADEDIKWYNFINPIYLGGAVEKAKEIGDELLSQGNFEYGMRFMQIANYKPTKNELKRFAKVALANDRIQDAISFYQFETAHLTPKQARKILAAARVHENQAKGTSVVDAVFEYMEEMPVGLTEDDYREQGDLCFTRDFNNNKYQALDYYLKSGDKITPLELKERGLDILAGIKHGEEGSYKLAFKYLGMYDKSYAIQTMENIARWEASENPHHVETIYNVTGQVIPEDVALVAAQASIEKGWYGNAAKFYLGLGQKEKVSEMGDAAISAADLTKGKEADNSSTFYEAQKCFELIDDKDKLAEIEFLRKNFSKW